MQARFAAHRYRGLVAEGAVDKLLLLPLLDLVGFYEPEYGEEFIFLKVLASPTPIYSTPKLCATFFLPDGQDLAEVVQVLKQMKTVAASRGSI